MKRFLLDEFKPIPDKEPKTTARVHSLVQDVIDGTMRANDYSAEEWQENSPRQKLLQDYIKRFGDFVALTLVEQGGEDGPRSYRYRMEFQKATVLYHFVFDETGRLKSGNLEDQDWKLKPAKTEMPVK